jgi:hypothetical protein
MVFEAVYKKDTFTERIYEKSMKDLEKFFGFRWGELRPKVFAFQDRKSINEFLDVKTDPWVVGMFNGTNIFVLDRKAYGKQSSNIYSDKNYAMLIEHELANLFFERLSGFNHNPLWLFKGTSLYLSGQTKYFNSPERFEHFLKYHNRTDAEIFVESGVAVELLVKTYGKQKILRLIKSLGKINSKKEFASRFKEIYGFELSYKNFNKVLKGEKI